MQKTLSTCRRLMLFLTALLALPSASFAQESGKPIIELKTAVLEQEGVETERTITLFLGGFKQETDWIDIDCGYGTEEHELQPATISTSTGQWTGGTSITCDVSTAGVVKIYGDAANIAVIRFDGCYITDITLADMPNLYYLNMEHNLLHELDLSNFPSLASISLNDNPFDRKPLKIGGNKPKLMLLEIGQTENLDQSFNLSDYPELVSFDAYANKGLRTLDPSGCPKLQRLSIDGTNVKTLDLSKNPTITILNISDTGIKDIDLSSLTYLQQFYADHQSSSMNTDAKLTKLDVTKNEKLVYLFASGNLLTDIDLSKNYYLQQLYLADNQLTSMNLENNPNLINVILRKNNMDFATLPLPGEWNQYDYYQNNMPIAKTVKVGDVLDYSARVLREGTETSCAVFTTSEETAGMTTRLSEEYYTYADGKVTFLAAPSDSVYIAFQNDKFPDLTFEYMPLRTNKFKVKTVEDFGKEDVTAVIRPTLTPSEVTVKMRVGMAGATPESPKTFYIADSQGNKKEYKATTAGLPDAENVVYQGTDYLVNILVPQDEAMTSLAIEGQQLNAIDLTQARCLGTLSLTGSGLYDIDLRYNRVLRSLKLTDNHFSTLNIRGLNDAYQKTLLQDIDLSNNEMTAVTLNDMGTIHNLNLSHNKLTELSLKDADNMETLYLNDNMLETVNANYCTLMTDFDISNNNISELVMPSELSLQRFRCNDNKLSFATLPVIAGLEEYVYAPQNDVVIATKAPGVDLQLHNVEGKTTYVWKTTDGTVLQKGTDYTITDGMTRFLDPAIGKKAYCEMTNALFPLLTVKTTTIEASDMPSYKIASFTTTEDGEGTMVLRSEIPTTICIDWKGGGVAVESYSVTNDLVVTPVKAQAGSECAIYAYEAETPLYVLNITGIKMKDVDLTNMKNLTLVNLTSAGITDVKLPESKKLAEIILDGNAIEAIDLSKYASQLRMVSINNNLLTSFDATGMKNLFSLSLGGNKLTSVTLDNPSMYNLQLSGNELETIDLSKAPNVSQLFLTNNKFESIDLTPLKGLVALTVDYNRFRISTLPRPNANYTVFLYGNQANIDAQADENGVVDLSSEAYVGETPTTFRWFIDFPWYDEDSGELTGEELYYDDEVFITEGKTRFTKALDNVVCAMLNEEYPNLTLYTNAFNVTTVSGVENIFADNGSSISIEGKTISVSNSVSTRTEVFSANGTLVATSHGTAASFNVAPGIYIVKNGENTVKAVVR